MKKNLECGFENAIELEEGRSPTSERTAVALSSPGPLTSPTSTLPVEAPAKLPCTFIIPVLIRTSG